MQEKYQNILNRDFENSLETLNKIHQNIISLGFLFAFFMIFKPQPSNIRDVFTHGNAPEYWIEEYTKRSYLHADPLMLHCFQKHRPIIWNSDLFKCGQAKKIYSFASQLGMKSGVAMPIHTSGGAKGMLNCVIHGGVTEDESRSFLSKLPELLLLRDCAMDVLGVCSELSCVDGPPRLSKRETECLQWHANGKTSWEIGKILFISEACVNFHFNNIREKFGVTRRQDAVPRALAMGLIRNPLEWMAQERALESTRIPPSLWEAQSQRN